MQVFPIELTQEEFSTLLCALEEYRYIGVTMKRDHPDNADLLAMADRYIQRATDMTARLMATNAVRSE